MKDTEKPEELEWIKLYWVKFIASVGTWKANEIGAYLLLLIYQWDNGFIPADEEQIAEIAKVSYKKLSKVMKKFRKVDNVENQLFNKRLEIIRSEQLEQFAKASASGKKGAEARWKDHNERKAKAMGSHSDSKGNRREKNRIEEIRTEESEKGSHDHSISFPLEKLSLVMQAEVSWLESVCRKYKCDFDFASAKILDFITHLETQAITSKTLTDAKSHYDNWFRIQITNATAAATRKSGTGKSFDRTTVEQGVLKHFSDQQQSDDTNSSS